jgi:hypothetical protein
VQDLNQFPHGVPRVIPPEEFFQAHQRLREADYRDHWLRDVALAKIQAYAQEQQRYRKETPQDEIYYLWALCLQVEILDYYEQHTQMQEVLEKDGTFLKNDLRASGILGTGYGLVSRPLMRQQLWLLILLAHSEYRLSNPKEAKQILEDVRDQLDTHFPLDKEKNPDEPSYGLRARIAYSLGQVLRHLSDPNARAEFIYAIWCTRQRLLAKTLKYGRSPEREQSYANYIVAKSFAFGLAWASFHNGELQRALGAASAGSALLESGNDPVHKAYAHVMYAQILSAKARPVRNSDFTPRDLDETIELLVPIAIHEDSPLTIVPKLLARARYVLANAYFLAHRLREAEQLARQVYDGKSPGRWRLECAALLVRILLVEDRIDDARRYSDTLLILTKEPTVTNAQRAEALLCHVEVLLQAYSQEKNPETGKAIEKALDEAANLTKDNPLLSSACVIERGRYYVRIKNKDKAQGELSTWEVMAGKIENGYIQQMGEDLRWEIARLDPRLIIEPEVLLDAGDHGKVDRMMRYWILLLMNSKYGPQFRKKASEFLDVAESTIDNWVKDTGFIPRNKKGPA